MIRSSTMRILICYWHIFKLGSDFDHQRAVGVEALGRYDYRCALDGLAGVVKDDRDFHLRLLAGKALAGRKALPRVNTADYIARIKSAHEAVSPGGTGNTDVYADDLTVNASQSRLPLANTATVLSSLKKPMGFSSDSDRQLFDSISAIERQDLTRGGKSHGY